MGLSGRVTKRGKMRPEKSPVVVDLQLFSEDKASGKKATTKKKISKTTNSAKDNCVIKIRPRHI